MESVCLQISGFYKLMQPVCRKKGKNVNRVHEENFVLFSFCFDFIAG